MALSGPKAEAPPAHDPLSPSLHPGRQADTPVPPQRVYDRRPPPPRYVGRSRDPDWRAICSARRDRDASEVVAGSRHHNLSCPPSEALSGPPATDSSLGLDSRRRFASRNDKRRHADARGWVDPGDERRDDQRGQPAAFRRAKPASRSALMSATSSRPIWIRTVGPAGSHFVAVRCPASKGRPGSRSRPTTRPCRTAPGPRAWPPRPASRTASTRSRTGRRRRGSRASTARGRDGFGRAGWITRATSGRCSSQRAMSTPDRQWRSSRTSMVRMPRRPEIHLLGAGADAEAAGFGAPSGRSALVGGDGAQHRVGMADDVLGRGLDRDVDAVRERLEVERARPGVVHHHQGAAACAAAAMAGMSCTSNVCEPGSR